MKLWRRISKWALLGLSASALLVACSGSDGEDDNDGQFKEGQEAQVKTNSPVIYPSIDVGETETRAVEITNTGGDVLELSNITLTEGDEDNTREFTAGANWRESAEIGPDDDPLKLDVTYSPLNSTRDTATVTFESNASNLDGENTTTTVELKPEKLEPLVNAPDSVNFSSAQPGTQVWQKFNIQNVGEAPLEISKLQLSGSDLFQLTVPPADDMTGGSGSNKGDQSEDGPTPDSDKKLSDVLPTTLKPDEKFEVRGWFEPEDNKPEDATVTIFSNDPNGKSTIKLLGNSKAPCLGLSHDADDGVQYGSASTGKITRETITLENCRPRSKKQLKIRNIEITDDANGVFGLEKDSLPGDLESGKTFELPGGERANFVVTFTPPKNKSYEGELLIESNDPSRANYKIPLKGSGTDNECPTAIAKGKVEGSSRKKTTINTLPLETIVLDASSSSDPDGSVDRYEWSIIARPQDSTARLTPNSNVKNPDLYLDLAGTYKVELTVYDDQGAASCGEQAVVEVKAIPQEDIHVQLVWDTPSDQDQTDSSGSDLDLHYLNAEKASAWARPPWDIYWNNPNKNGKKWGDTSTASDDPSLDIDDTDGAGPENVNHDNPVSGQEYTVGVYYYDDHGFGPSYATVRIYTNGTLAREYKNKFMAGTFDFWKVAKVEWPTGNVYPRDEKYSNGYPSNP